MKPTDRRNAKPADRRRNGRAVVLAAYVKAKGGRK